MTEKTTSPSDASTPCKGLPRPTAISQTAEYQAGFRAGERAVYRKKQLGMRNLSEQEESEIAIRWLLNERGKIKNRIADLDRQIVTHEAAIALGHRGFVFPPGFQPPNTQPSAVRNLRP